MKITKVKLDKQIVQMQRDRKQGYLLHGQQHKKLDEQILDLLNKKQKSFAMSLLGKTLVKDSTFNCSKNMPKDEKEKNKQKQQNLKKLKRIFEYNLNLTAEPPQDLAHLNKLTKQELKEYLAHKFAEDKSLVYNKQTTSFNLLNELYLALKNNNPKIESYQQWSTWFISNKKHFLVKSIMNNKIKSVSSVDGKSKRQQELDKLAEQMVNNTLSLDVLYEPFSPIISQWQMDFEKTKKYTQQDVDGVHAQGKNNEVGYPVDLFEFKRQLKKTLHTHQHELYRAGEFTDNKLLEQYSLELTKYLERYFPLKKSGRRLTVADIKYYLADDTIKNTIQQQFHNAIMQYLLQQGKYLSYQLGDNISSQDLQRIKAQEAFSLQFINACSFAASNLRNILGTALNGDILIQSGFKIAFDSIMQDDEQNAGKQKNDGIHRLCQFLFRQSFDFKSQIVITDHDELIKQLKQEQQYLSVMNTIRCAIYSIRNNVIHFTNNSLEQLFQAENFTLLEYDEYTRKTKNKNEATYTQQTILLSLFKRDLNCLNTLFAEKVRTSGILDFYATDDIARQLKKINLMAKPLPFIPGFKKVFKWGATYQQESKNYLTLRTYFTKAVTLEAKSVTVNQADQAKYNLLALIYEQTFIHRFLDDKSLFKKACDAVLDANKQRAIDKPSKSEQRKQAFAEIAYYAVDQLPQDYLREAHAQLINEENKKRDDGKLTEEQTGHYQQFIWQLFVKGFDDFITNTKDLHFVGQPKWQYDEKTEQIDPNQQHQQVEKLANLIDVSTQIDPTNNSQLAFWLFCKMLDANYLNQLNNQFSKWQQAQQAIGNQFIDISIFQQIIQLSLLTCDITPTNYLSIYKTSNAYFAALQPFVSLKEDKIKNKINIFIQSDEKTPIIHGSIEQAKKYATYRVLCKLLEQQTKFKINGKDIDDWERVIKEGHKNNPATLSQQRQKLHDEWAKSPHKIDYFRNRSDKVKTIGWLNSPCAFSTTLTNGQYYQTLCTQLEQYNWLDNKVHLVYVRQLHNLLIDILARLAGFINLLERDFQFLDQSSSRYREDDPYRLSAWTNFYLLITKKDENELEKILDVNKNSSISITNADLFKKLSEKRHFYLTHFFVNNSNAITTRNYIAHFNYLDKMDDNKTILDLLADVRALFAYDRKLKNAVAKSFIDLFDRHGMTLRFKPLHENNHYFVIDSLKSKKIEHLAGQKFDNGKDSNGKRIQANIEIDQVNKDYIDMVRALLTLKQKDRD